ncbi:hypothetical protein [Inquilinus sp. CAU 1745]|uniref:flagellar basal body-associated FliL family protein n=1 Tax=Inquilinus sp. CAU 1745 TaxID=3140369 RepID=UPI00325AFA05
MKKIVILGLAALLVGGAGFGGWMFLANKSAEAAEIEEPAATPPVYVEFDPIQLPIMGDDRIVELVNIALALEVPDTATADRVIAMAPKLTDAYIHALYGAINREEAMVGGALDVTMLKRRLLQVSNEVMGAGQVSAALVQMLTQRRL